MDNEDLKISVDSAFLTPSAEVFSKQQTEAIIHYGRLVTRQSYVSEHIDYLLEKQEISDSALPNPVFLLRYLNIEFHYRRFNHIGHKIRSKFDEIASLEQNNL